MDKNNERILETYFKYYIIQRIKILNKRNSGLRAHKENQFKNKNVETNSRKLQNQLQKATNIAIFIENKLVQSEDLKPQVQKAMLEDEKEREEISMWDCQVKLSVHPSRASWPYQQ